MADQTDSSSPRDWRDTVFLPKTDFPMKAGLAAKEPQILERWQRIGLYGKLREQRAGAERFILHDGPPYANGDIHMGHALNKVLKDLVVRTRSLMGYDAPYVPGWDCHGLPIEWKIEEQYRKKKQSKDEVPPAEFRAECRAYAAEWVGIQRAQFERLGVMGDWDDPYLTMKFEAEATIAGELLKFAETGQLYRGAKPVMWSPVEKTALAEAEVEYEDITSTQIDVAFEIVEAPNAPELVGAHAVIWTTTPWTIPVNQALAYGPAVEYHLIDCYISDNSSVKEAGLYLVAKDLVEATKKRLHTRDDEYGVAFLSEPKAIITGAQLAGAVARHPMHHLGGFFARPRPFLPGDFVTTDQGTGLVHMAPDHGEDDFDLCKANGLDPVFAVEGDGRYRADWGWLGGQGSVINPKFNAPDGPICEDLRAAGALLAASADYRHSYPHSWRSKAKLIFRATPQWFIPMDRSGSAQPSPLPLAGGAGGGHAAVDAAPPPSPLPQAGGGARAEIVTAPEDPDLPGAVVELPAATGDAIGYSASLDYLLLSHDGTRHLVAERDFPAFSKRTGATLAGFQALIKGALLEGATARLGNATVPFVADPAVSLDSDTAFTVQGAATASGNARTLRDIALDAIERTRWVPEKGRNRIAAMVAGRPDWVISRQRAWGVPIALYVDRATGDYLRDPAVNARILAAFREGGADAWYAADHQQLLGPGHRLADYEPVQDILDVWFDSGSTHAFVIEARYGEGSRADLYLEGSDQHRGWFQSSLLESCGTRGRAPYDAVLTHGFALDGNGRKMSKSLGNVVDPLKIMADSGADILRLWAAATDYFDDVKIGKDALSGASDAYRKLRNSFRYLLGALDGFTAAERLPAADMPELERYILHRLTELDAELRAACEAYEFNRYVRALSDFANEDLSAFFFDIRKDSLYCDAADSPKRRAYRTVLDILLEALVRWAAPLIPFTAEEVWLTRYPSDDGSVHLQTWPDIDAGWADAALADRWQGVRTLREQVTEAIEPLRREKIVRSSLEAAVTVPEQPLPPADLAETFISAAVSPGDTIAVARTDDHKCGRCWRHLPDVAEDGALCGRCAEVVT